MPRTCTRPSGGLARGMRQRKRNLLLALFWNRVYLSAYPLALVRQPTPEPPMPISHPPLDRATAVRVCHAVLCKAADDCLYITRASDRIAQAAHAIELFDAAKSSSQDLFANLEFYGRPADVGQEATWEAIHAIRACSQILAVAQ